VAKNKIIIETGVLAPIEVESLFDKRPDFSRIYRATNGSFVNF
jgi:hypothetical protein